jgi:vacuolar protein sorting-associated protein 72
MTFAAERERRQTAGNRLKRLLEQQEDPDDEFYGTAYGGFLDEEEDNDYHSEESEEDVVDSDFDQEDEEQQQQQQQQGEDEQEQIDTNKKRKNDEDSDGDDETVKRKRKKVIYQAQSLQQELKAQKREEQEQTGESKLTRQQQKKANTPKIEPKTLRKSTSVKRVELEKRQKQRQERRVYLKGVASLRNTREVRKLTQEELLEEAKITEEINLESLEAYQQIELKKKENKRMKLIQECPRICTSSMTILNEPNDQWNDLLDESYQLETISERFSRTFVSFTHIQTYNETFSKLNSSNRHHRRLCPITGMPAQYFDPLTQQPYATLEAFKILRRIYTEEMKKQKRTIFSRDRDIN